MSISSEMNLIENRGTNYKVNISPTQTSAVLLLLKLEWTWSDDLWSGC